MAWSWLSDLIGPVMSGLDELVTSDDERAQNENKRLDIKRQIFALETSVTERMVKLEVARMEMVAERAASDAKSDSWYVKARRPFLEVSAFAILAASAIGLIPDLPTSFQYGGWILLGVNNGLRGGKQITEAVMRRK